jgi:hypothetical protein
MIKKKTYQTPITKFICIQGTSILTESISNQSKISVNLNNSKEATTGITPMAKSTNDWDKDELSSE